MKKIIKQAIAICLFLSITFVLAVDFSYADNTYVKDAPKQVYIFTGTVRSFSNTNIVVVNKINNIYYSYFFNITDSTKITGHLALGTKVEVTYTRKTVSSNRRYRKTALKIRVLE